MDTPSKVEFAVKIKGPACVETVKLKLTDNGISSQDIEAISDNQNKEARIVIKTARPWIELQETIEETGKQAVLVGFSDQAAVAMLDKGGNDHVKGVIRFCSITSSLPGIVIDGVIDGLQPKQDHELSICEYGDVSQGCNSLGEVYKKSSYRIKSDESGRSTIRTVDSNLQVSELIGRSVAVSPLNGTRLACGIISRAAGIFQNWKRICACDGVTIWDERDRPLAGAGRRV
jgi:copper chaperone for superoxide dismutase